MKKIKLRWLFPICHLVIDLAIAAILFHSVLRERQIERVHERRPQSEFISVGFFQENVPGVRFDPQFLPPPQFTLLIMGSLPAGLISVFVIPSYYASTWEHPFNFRWLALQEALALTLWFLLGLAAESRPTIRRCLVGLILLRILAAIAVEFFRDEFWAAPLVYYWVVLLIVVAVSELRRLRGKVWGRHDGGEPPYSAA